MWFYLCSVLALGCVQSLTIGSPYRTLLSYDAIHSPQKAALTPQAYLIYLDNSGTERIVNFNYAQPVYAIRRINFINSETTPVHQNLPRDGPNEVNEAREAHFRAWSLQQYQVLKREIDLLRADGKQPARELALKFQPLEKIALTSDYSTIADLPEIKRIEEEHLTIWKNILQTDDEQIKLLKKNSIDGTKSSTIEMEEINVAAQIDELKQKQSINGSKSQDVESESRFANEKANKKEIVSAEHKLERHTSEIEKSDSTTTRKNDRQSFEENSKQNTGDDKQNSVEETTKISPSNVGSRLDTRIDAKITHPTNSSVAAQNKLSDADISHTNQPQTVLATRKVSEAPEEPYAKLEKDVTAEKYATREIEKLIAAAPAVYVPQQVVDTAEVMRARNEHLKIVEEAIQKAKLAQVHEQQRKANQTKTARIELIQKKD